MEAPCLVNAEALTAVVCQSAEAGRELGALVQEALPGATVALGISASAALERANAHRLLGKALSLIVIDGRGRAIGGLSQDLSLADSAAPDAEVVLVSDAGQRSTLGELLAAAKGLDRITILTAPLDIQVGVETIRRLAARHEILSKARKSLQSRDLVEERLQLEAQELRARLDIARHAARHDDLTGVLNRKGFVEALTARLERGNQEQCVLMIDLDRFKAVNDTLGHAAGDELVRKISTGLASVLPAGGVLARLGGDEFGILVEGEALHCLDDLCARVLKICSATRTVCGQEVQVSSSLGLSRRSASAKPSELMRQADLAMYAAKREGRNRRRAYDTELDRIAQHRASIETGLERALRSGEFKMVYQPIVSALEGRILGFEALIRWDSPEHGAISPAEFIPVAEESGLILEIGDWIARQALKDCRRWDGPYVSINLSARQFLRHNVGERILRYAQEAALQPGKLQIELTETAIIDDVERADRNLRTLRDAGVRVALDDFGTGYSSLVYLKQFAIDCIKIDKSFVDSITTDRQCAMIVASVAKLASSLGMEVVAEGVETADQRAILIAAGCGMLQGYLFQRPVEACEVHALINGERALPITTP